ncbi:lysophospholipid acyltransferase family protein [Alteraurantiacibacter aestuarii]|uniref:1-acyl-sn-glycerol-3-phosphate acyltransferase n=1 Tax=Alteraurantiacibacter aestuarii TaxID=650004 RepID=A0A844ZFB5_9SPHN|nr:lysophospholipid acyltransferase family protein [Alteraurantiacibacter aestuarii]MXO87221.1 1-acyl-sn-glycerol-3-phosphate acyltransferase [Alteraurantiacibacter aestuarii]
MHVLRSLIFYVAFYGGSVFHVLGAMIALRVAPRWLRPICDAWSGWHHWCVENLLGIRIEITGINPKGVALFAIKHESFFEAIEVPHLFNHPAGFAKQELFDIPGWGKVAAAYGAIPVARDEGAKALRTMLKDARMHIAAGRPMIIFPEGTRVPPGQRPELQAGFAALYKMLKLPVIPVAVESGRVYETMWKRPGVIRVHFGEPIETGLSREEIEDRTRAAINIFNGPQETPDA